MSFLTLWKNRSSESTQGQSLGRTVGIVWEYTGFHSSKPTACIVQIKREPRLAVVTVYDPNDRGVTSVTNLFEQIATGVYLEHLKQYRPEEVQFYHRDAVGTGIQKWGESLVKLTWDKESKAFTNPEWQGFKLDESKSPVEEAFLDELKTRAAVSVETYMRERHERGETNEREKELYDAFQEYLADTSQKYNLRMKLV